RLLVLTGYSSGICLWDLRTGEQLWHKTSQEAELEGVQDICFARDGRSFIACNMDANVLTFETRTGRRLGQASLKRGETSPLSATLAPNGSRGAFVGVGERLYTFDAATGAVQDTGMAAAWPVRFSSDGQRLACRSNNSGTREELRIVSLDGRPAF